jgi:hypothetical protein
MCFSATASFGAGAVLTVIGVASIKIAPSKTQLPFGTIPLIFAVQQITEGFLWLALTNPAYASLREVATYNFLFFAQVVWPAWVPYAIYKFTPKDEQRTFGKILVATGVLVSTYLAYCLLSYPVEANVVGYHISYTQDYPVALSRYGGLLYIIATIAPPFFSRVKGMWMLGAAILISYVITAILYTDYIVSVWCFFASIISIAILAIMHQHRSSARTVLTISTT